MTPLAEVLDKLNMSPLDLESGSYVTGAMVVLKVRDIESREISVHLMTSSGLGWLDQIGMVTVAHSAVNVSPSER